MSLAGTPKRQAIRRYTLQNKALCVKRELPHIAGIRHDCLARWSRRRRLPGPPPLPPRRRAAFSFQSAADADDIGGMAAPTVWTLRPSRTHAAGAPPLPYPQALAREAADRIMHPLADRPQCRPHAIGFLLALAAALSAGSAARAVGDDGIYYSRDAADDGAYFSSRSTFRIPFGDVDRRIQEVILYVSADFGKSYQRVTSAAPTDKEFRFQAPRDGWYWFTVQTRDADGRLAPPDLSVAQPQIKVCVDTHAPVVSLRWLSSQAGYVGVEWDVNDLNLDVSTLRVDYRTANGDWSPLPIKQAARGQYSWNPGPSAPVEARLQVQDKAHNPAEYKAPVGGAGYPTVGPTPNPATGSGAAPPSDGPVGLIMVNTKRIQLDFDIQDVGSSKVKAVEVWYTQDGHRWQKTPKDAAPEPPYYVDVPAEGRYGFTLIARSGVGLALPAPKDGDAPQVWVEVDVTKPDVKVLGVEVGRGPDTGYITVRWNATDKHLAANPVTISYAEASAGASPQWQPITTAPVPNDGRYVWRMPEGLPPLILVRVEAVDQAGNVGAAETTSPVSTDLSIPKARVKGVRGAAEADAAPPP